eukprot:TRINITY_DN6242_c0_g1_i1.p1 TRINITY_DN6242_c0_g1~~TRINITY_DN6242_c0_g1_i1.p1  ORF type:complete len:157 (+),score=16.41 TRINITY_DN6242_c0_g1_i1:66-536(+)
MWVVKGLVGVGLAGISVVVFRKTLFGEMGSIDPEITPPVRFVVMFDPKEFSGGLLGNDSLNGICFHYYCGSIATGQNVLKKDIKTIRRYRCAKKEMDRGKLNHEVKTLSPLISSCNGKDRELDAIKIILEHVAKLKWEEVTTGQSDLFVLELKSQL